MIETSIATPEWIATTVVAWLATYIVHSTLLIGAVWVFTRWCTLDSLTRSLLWKLALVGGLFTATLQAGLGVRPWLGQVAVASEEEAASAARWEARSPDVVLGRMLALQVRAAASEQAAAAEIDRAGALAAAASARMDGADAGLGRDVRAAEREAAAAEREAAAAEREAAAAAERELRAMDWRAGGFLADSGPRPGCSGTACPLVHVASDSDEVRGPGGSTRGPWPILAGLFVAGLVVSVGRLMWLAWRLRGVLRGRETLTQGALRGRLVVLLGRARLAPGQVRLTVSPVLRSPVALASGEIVVPTRALELDARQQEAMLAHELAHVVRRDPAWLVLAAVIEAALFIQPLNRVARRGMQEAAEELSDDWAVRHIGDGLHLARCLAEVAGWLEHGHQREMFVSPMASEGGSMLVRRVRRLLEAGPRRGLAVHWRLLLAACLLFAAGLGAPGFAPSLARAGEAVTPPVSPPVAEVVRVAMAPVAPTAVVPAAARSDAPAQPTARQHRIVRRADRLEQRANKQAARAAALRERSGLHDTCPDERQRGPSEREDARMAAIAAGVAAIEQELAAGLRELPDMAAIERELAAGLRELPDTAALERELAGLRELPDLAELERSLEAALAELPDGLPNKDELERSLQDALRDLPSEEMLDRSLQDALRDLPNKEMLERSLQDALRDLPSTEMLDRSLQDALRGLADAAAREGSAKQSARDAKAARRRGR